MKLLFLLIVLLVATPASAQIVTYPGASPSMGTCGSSPSVAGNNSLGVITVGNGAVTSCSLNFSTTLDEAPKCLASISDSSLTFSIAVTTTGFTVTTSSSIGSGKIFYLCGLSS